MKYIFNADPDNKIVYNSNALHPLDMKCATEKDI